MGCGCNDPINSWYDWAHQMPADILDLVAMARLGGTVGTFLNSTSFNTPPVAWTAAGIGYSGEPLVAALATDSGLAINNSDQFNFGHELRNQSALLAPPLQKVIFARAGTQWENLITLAFGGVTYNDLQLSFRDNAGTRGDAQGTIPVISWAGAFTGNQQLGLVFKQKTQVSLMIRAITSAGDWSAFEMEVKVI
ncbi:MAG: hypothetical protein JNJ94_09000 [Chlorobi bacterium]|nr:hypothetical protein [Chlorobiota bacterium]